MFNTALFLVMKGDWDQYLKRMETSTIKHEVCVSSETKNNTIALCEEWTEM